MSALKVLQLSTYPISPRIHGGQRRCGAIYDGLRRNNVDVLYISIGKPAGRHLPAGQIAIEMKGRALRALLANALLEDILIGQTVFQDSHTRNEFLHHAARFKPDVIVLEQPYLWPGLQRLVADGALAQLPTVYSSYNIEHAMKEESHARWLPPGERVQVVGTVRRWEEELCRRSDLVIAVSAADADVLRGMGAKQCVVVRNGNEAKAADPAKVAEWRERLLGNGGVLERFAVFVSSAHLPNCLDLEKLVGRFLGYLPPHVGMVVAGGAAAMIEEMNICNARSNLSRSRLKLYKSVSDADIAALLHLSSAVMLPVLRGGGANIKTVEALFSGRPIIGTSFAFRSFEEFAGLERVRICDRPDDFQATLQQALLHPSTIPARPDFWDEELESLTWAKLGDQFAREIISRDWRLSLAA